MRIAFGCALWRRKRVLATPAPTPLPQGKSQRWSLDFVLHAPSGVRRFHAPAVMDDCTRACLALVANSSLSGLPVGGELNRIVVPRRTTRLCS
jgi:putative transposase